jgi:periplasmic protein TonB
MQPFGESLIESGGKAQPTKRWLTFPISLIVHVLIIGAVVVVPLMMASSNLPELKVTNVFMVTTPPPPPPPPPAAKKKTSTQVREEQKKEEIRPILAGRLVAPIEIPEQIQDEDISSFGVDGGVDGGVEGGVEGGVIGGVLGGVEGGDMGDSSALRVASVQRPKLVKRVAPIYPQVALTARIQGVVIVEAETDIYGRVRTSRVVSGHPLLNDAAIQAVRQWVFEPYILNGIPKPVIFTVTVTFSLQN